MSAAARWPSAALLALVLAATAVAYRPGLRGPFVFDDYHNVVANPFVAAPALTWSSLADAAYSGGGRYPDRALARASFLASYRLAGGAFDPFAFKVANLAVHLVDGVLVWWLASCLLGRAARAGAGPGEGGVARARAGALLAAAVWVLHPIQLTSVLYVVQRMTSMSAAFVLAGLVAYAYGRERLEAGRRGGLATMAAGIAGAGALGFLCKENAALLPYLAALVEIAFFRRDRLAPGARRGLLALFGLLAVVPALAVLGWLAADPGAVLGAYSRRAFGPFERLATEARVLFEYLYLMVYPDPAHFGLFHDDIALSTGPATPWTTLPAIAAWAVLAALAARGLARGRVWAFAIAWFLVGHAMESTLLPLEIAHEHRNYVPSVGLALAAGWYLAAPLARPGGAARVGAVGLIVVAVLGLVTTVRAGTWADEPTLLTRAVRHHPRSARTQAAYAQMLAARSRAPVPVFEHWQRAAALDRAWIEPLVEMARIVAAERAAFGQRGAGPRALAAPDPLAASLHGGATYLAALESAIAREVDRRLDAARLPYGTVGALRDVARCAVAGEPVCLALRGRVREWLARARANPRVSDGERAIAALAEAKLRAATGDVAGAVALARRAAALDPAEVHYALELAALYLRLGDLSAAGEALDRARTLVRAHRRGAREVEALARRLRRARAGS